MVQIELDEEEEVAEKHDRYIYKRKCSLTRVRFMICEYRIKNAVLPIAQIFALSY
jgi:hypothetical protein